eukprot:9102560-Pyramimonas_sp.AAC.1
MDKALEAMAAVPRQAQSRMACSCTETPARTAARTLERGNGADGSAHPRLVRDGLAAPLSLMNGRIQIRMHGE